MDLFSTIGQLFSTFGVEWVKLAFQLITFVVLLVGLRFILYKPVVDMLEQRKARIAQGLKDAQQAAEDRAASEKEAAARLAKATKTAEKLLAEAESSAKKMKEQIAAETQAELARNRQVQQEVLLQMREDMLREIKGEVAALVVSTTEKVLRQGLDAKQQQQFAASAAKELEKA